MLESNVTIHFLLFLERKILTEVIKAGKFWLNSFWKA